MRNVIVSLALAALVPVSAFASENGRADIEKAEGAAQVKTERASCMKKEYYTVNMVVQGRLQPVRMERVKSTCG